MLFDSLIRPLFTYPAILAVFTLPLLAACNSGQVAPAPKPVVALQLALTDTTPRDEYSGDVHARHESVLGFRVPGKIVARYVNLGDSVHQGQLLAKLDAGDAELN